MVLGIILPTYEGFFCGRPNPLADSSVFEASCNFQSQESTGNSQDGGVSLIYNISILSIYGEMLDKIKLI